MHKEKNNKISANSFYSKNLLKTKSIQNFDFYTCQTAVQSLFNKTYVP